MPVNPKPKPETFAPPPALLMPFASLLSPTKAPEGEMARRLGSSGQMLREGGAFEF